ENFSDKYGEQAVVMCALDQDGSLKMNTIDSPLVPASGQTLIAMVNVTPVPEGHAALDASAASNEGPGADTTGSASDK
ncbi:unnamed protein product, partial [Hapterophycus canaliculatus]